MERRNAVLYAYVLETRLYSIPQRRKDEEWNDDEEEEEGKRDEKEMVILHVHFDFGAVYRLCSLPQNQTRAALYSAPT